MDPQGIRSKGRLAVAAICALLLVPSPWASRAHAGEVQKISLGAPSPTRGSNPWDLTATESGVFFTAPESRLWIVDSLTLETRIVKEFETVDHAWPSVRPVAARGDTLVFTVEYTLVMGDVLSTVSFDYWVTDGTTAGTRRFYQQSELGFAEVAVLDETILFSGWSEETGWEPWRSDGTPEGTAVLVNLQPGAESSFPGSWTRVGERIFFVVSDGPDREIWKTDGTPEGTALVKERIHDGEYPSVQWLAPVGDALFFVADDGIHGLELWISDGSSEGTKPVVDLAPGPEDPGYRFLTGTGGRLFFSAEDPDHGRELWTSDGTEAGTQRVKDIFPGPDGSNPSPPRLEFQTWGGAVLFVADDGVHGAELWISDGTESGTRMLRDIQPPGATTTIAVTSTQDAIFLTANDGETGAELWTSDGSEESTRLLEDIRLGPSSSARGNLVALGGRVFFPADDGIHGAELWTSDGTEEGTRLVADLDARPEGSNPMSLLVQGDRLYFSATDAERGRELWRTDGTPEGTTMVKDIVEGRNALGPASLVPFRDELFFVPSWGDLWKSDGTEEGTVRVIQVLDVGEIASAGDVLYFSADDGESGHELWRTDGTSEGTRRLTDIRLGLEGSAPAQFAPVRSAAGESRLLFTADDGVHGREVWVSDGTEEGTYLLQDFRPGALSSEPAELTETPGRVFFTTRSPTDSARTLWVSDGSREGTFDLNREGFPGSPQRLTFASGRVFFSVGPSSLWQTDGSAKGTEEIRSVLPGQFSVYPLVPFPEVRSDVYFALVNYPSSELWRSDGSAGGTILVSNRWSIESPFEFSAGLRNMAGVDDRLLFSARDSDTGWEPWLSDGTEEGTRRLLDLRPGPDSSSPDGFTDFLGSVVFSAVDATGARELWILRPDRFQRGDSNIDGTANLSDAVFILQYLFLGSPRTLACEKSADLDRDGGINITDALVLLNYLFLGGPQPLEPFEACGEEPPGGRLTCWDFPPCR